MDRLVDIEGEMLRKFVSGIFKGIYHVSAIGAAKGPHLVRYSMYRHIAAALGDFKLDGKALSISHSQHLCQMAGALPQDIVEANYPEVSILDLPFADNSFSFLASDQVFEHIEGNPQRAMDESLRVIKPGGVMVHTTCFLTPNHGPGDYWRYTPEGLSLLCQKASRIIESSGWGNPLVSLATFTGVSRLPVPERRWHPLNMLARYNRDSYAFVVWIIAQK